jgi:hypothetical protein
MGPKFAKEVVPVLLDGLDIRDLKDQSPGGQAESKRYHIALALGKIGPAAADAVPKLQEILGDQQRRQGPAAAHSSGPGLFALLQLLVSLLPEKTS